MDGGGDNQFTARYNRRPVNRRVELILQDYQRWEPLDTANNNQNEIRIQETIAPPNRELSLHIEDDESGFESDSESDQL